ncbi:MAG TPA: hypothetical protein VIX84_08650, partial [Acidimicrobiales bacterium]
NTQELTISEGFVPASTSNSASASQNLNLRAFMVGGSDPSNYGRLTVYETPQGTPGPANADLEISANQAVSKDISLLDTNGSVVLLGETLMVPIGDSMVYLRPLYVAATTKPQPQLQYVVAVLGKGAFIESSLSAVLQDVLQTTIASQSPGVGSGTGTGTGTVPSSVSQDLAQAQTDYTNAQAALQAGNLGQYQTDIAAMEQQIAAAQGVLGTTTTTTTPTGTPTTTTTAPKGSKKTGSGTTRSTTTTSTTVPTSTGPQRSSTTTTGPASALAGR